MAILFGIAVSLCLTYEWLLFVQFLSLPTEMLSLLWYVGRIAVVCLGWGIVLLLCAPLPHERWVFPLVYALIFVLLQGQASTPPDLYALFTEALLSVLLACIPIMFDRCFKFDAHVVHARIHCLMGKVTK